MKVRLGMWSCSRFADCRRSPPRRPGRFQGRMCRRFTSACCRRSKRFPSSIITLIPGFADDPDVDAMASPPGSAALRTRDTNPELVAAAKALFGYPYNDLAPEHAKWLVQKKAELKKAAGQRLLLQYSRQAEYRAGRRQPGDDGGLSRSQALSLGLLR